MVNMNIYEYEWWTKWDKRFRGNPMVPGGDIG